MPFKLTDARDQTCGGTQWGPGVTHAATGRGVDLCSDGWIHYYSTLEVAALMNPVHANFVHPHAWEFVPEGEQRHEPCKSGCKRGTTVRRVVLPHATPEQRVYFAIQCAYRVYHNAQWVAWADAWIAGTDCTRTADAAAAAATAATYAAAAATAATYATAAATAAADAAAAAATAATYAAAAANAATYATAAANAADAATAAATFDIATLAAEACAWSS